METPSGTVNSQSEAVIHVPQTSDIPVTNQPEIIVHGQQEEIQIIVQDSPVDIPEDLEIVECDAEGENDGNTGGEVEAAEEGGQIATVQLGNLSCNSVQELAEHLPNIGIHFICKKCDVVCNQMSELLVHLSSGKCATTSNSPAMNPSTAASTSTSSAKRKRGRPRKQNVQPRELLPVKKEVDYEELPRLAAEPATLAKSNRRTRYSMGKIKRLDVLTLLGGRVKEEPIDPGEEDEEYTPKQKGEEEAVGREEEEEDQDDDISDDGEWAPRKRSKKQFQGMKRDKIQGTQGEVMEVVEEGGQMKVKPVPGHPTVSFRKEGSANLIVLDSGGKPDTDPDIISFAEDAFGKDQDNKGKDTTGDGAEGEVQDKQMDTETNQKENSDRDTTEDEDVSESRDGSKVTRATQGLKFLGLTTKYRKTKKRYHKCSICKQRFFHTREELTIHHQCHKNKKAEDELYGCPVEVCHFTTKAWNRMLDHLCRHEEYKEGFKDHFFVKNILGDFSCPICSKRFERKNSMKGHLAKVHFKQTKACGICNKVFAGVDEKTFKRHVEKCQNLLFQCSHCEYKTPVSANMRKHMKIHLGEGFTCDVCQAVFPSKQRLTVHKNTHEANRKQYSCDQCGTLFLSADAMRKHVIRFHTDTSTIYVCSECNFKTKIQSDLKKHFGHVHDKKFKCDQCPYQSNSSQAYEQHLEYHTPGRSYVCHFENCFYSGATPKQLTNHITQVHKTTKKYQCPICHKFYKKKTHLARHLVSHTEDKPYACLECGKEFNNHSTYYRHRNKTGHDAKREGIVSVPQNITIHYVNPDGEGIAQEGVEDQRVEDQQVVEEPAYQVITQGETGEYITSDETKDGEKKENILMLESEEGEPVTYVLRMSEGENGETTIMSEDGVPMDADVVQQIQEQLHLLQHGDSGSHHQMTEVVTAETEAVTLQGNIESVMNGSVVVESQVAYNPVEEVEVDGVGVEQVVIENTAQEVVMTGTGKDVEQAPLVIGDETHVTQEVYTEVTPEFQQACQQGEVITVSEDLTMGGQPVPDGMVSEWVVEQVEEVSDVKSAPVSHFIDQQQIGQEEVQQVIYEESVVEVGNPRGETGDGKKQYAIVLLPSNVASGDEPEAALSMLQLQSGNTITMSDNIEYIVQHSQDQ